MLLSFRFAQLQDKLTQGVAIESWKRKEAMLRAIFSFALGTGFSMSTNFFPATLSTILPSLLGSWHFVDLALVCSLSLLLASVNPRVLPRFVRPSLRVGQGGRTLCIILMMTGSLPNILHVLFLSYSSNLSDGYYYYFHFTDEETEALGI